MLVGFQRFGTVQFEASGSEIVGLKKQRSAVVDYLDTPVELLACWDEGLQSPTVQIPVWHIRGHCMGSWIS